MREKPQAQPDFLSVLPLNHDVPADHPLRAIKRHTNAVLREHSPLFDELYEELSRPSIPPEQRLKARVRTALYPIRSERLFGEQLGYNLLWLWFLDREFSEQTEECAGDNEIRFQRVSTDRCVSASARSAMVMGSQHFIANHLSLGLEGVRSN
jgi:transposase